MTRRLRIDPITRIEGHGRIDIRLDESGNVSGVTFQVPDFKGFEKFCQGRAAEEMPTLTQKICGVCPTAHHIAAVKTLDDLFGIIPPPAARAIRELMHTAFIFEDHLLHLFYLGGPDILVDGDVQPHGRNVFEALKTLDPDMARRAIAIRKAVRGLNGLVGGSPLYPVCGLPGGVSKPIEPKDREGIVRVATDALGFARDLMTHFHKQVINGPSFMRLARSAAFDLKTHYMGLVDDDGHVNFYDGRLQVVAPDGKTMAHFAAVNYLNHLAEHTDPSSYMKIVYLREKGWHGGQDGPDGELYRVGPLGRLNAAGGMATPLAQAEYERFFDAVGGKPAHGTLFYHWARLIEVMYAAERMVELAGAQVLTDPHVRDLPQRSPDKGVGVCEAPRGTLIHHYETDDRAIVKRANLVVATQNNAGAICHSVEKAARALIKNGVATDNLINQIEMAYRAYDPCLACATH